MNKLNISSKLGEVDVAHKSIFDLSEEELKKGASTQYGVDLLVGSQNLRAGIYQILEEAAMKNFHASMYKAKDIYYLGSGGYEDCFEDREYKGNSLRTFIEKIDELWDTNRDEDEEEFSDILDDAVRAAKGLDITDSDFLIWADIVNDESSGLTGENISKIFVTMVKYSILGKNVKDYLRDVLICGYKEQY